MTPLRTVSEYEAELRKMYQQLHPNTDWAHLPVKRRRTTSHEDKDEEDATQNLLSNAEPLLTQPRTLRKGRIDVTTVIDANLNDPHQSRLTSMEYSSDGAMFMTGTKNGWISLFHIDGIENPLIDAISIKSFKTIQAGFLPNKEQVMPN